MICSDTSFLFSLYANDLHSSLAVRWLTEREEPISITRFNEFELGNALRFAEYRELLPKGLAATYWAALHLGAHKFLTFVHNQKRLASHEGLTVIEFSGERKKR